MTGTIHQRVQEWLVASANGSLAPREREALAEHLAECPECGSQACDPEVVGELQRVMERHRQVPQGLEDRVLLRVEQGIASRRLTQSPRSQRHLRLALRVCLALVVCGLLAIRTLDLRWSLGNGWAGRVWSTVSQFVLRQPSYHHAQLVADEQGLLASCHQLGSHLVGALLWVLLLVLASQFTLDAWRRRRAVTA
ncbi:MAG: hypothetical protein HN849_04075 [Victivallales bacterium]|jgi:anti-sigma factor RsiW|nr:hypothetical protein [Victivallales bacterium]MBT7162926.1 hypothetical protein [Victivallales bacterium]MBT7298661.1 hypothetical protein [Victivallales bacterium]